MKKLKLHELQEYQAGGDAITGACYAVGIGDVFYLTGIVTNWWNPVGWVSLALAAASVACIAYGISQDE